MNTALAVVHNVAKYRSARQAEGVKGGIIRIPSQRRGPAVGGNCKDVSTHLKRILGLSKWFVDSNDRLGACGNLARGFIESNSLQMARVVIVNGLNDGFRVTKDGESAAGYVDLGLNGQSSAG